MSTPHGYSHGCGSSHYGSTQCGSSQCGYSHCVHTHCDPTHSDYTCYGYTYDGPTHCDYTYYGYTYYGLHHIKQPEPDHGRHPRQDGKVAPAPQLRLGQGRIALVSKYNHSKYSSGRAASP